MGWALIDERGSPHSECWLEPKKNIMRLKKNLASSSPSKCRRTQKESPPTDPWAACRPGNRQRTGRKRLKILLKRRRKEECSRGKRKEASQLNRGGGGRGGLGQIGQQRQGKSKRRRTVSHKAAAKRNQRKIANISRIYRRRGTGFGDKFFLYNILTERLRELKGEKLFKKCDETS
jgi:hypothetical protein